MGNGGSKQGDDIQQRRLRFLASQQTDIDDEESSNHSDKDDVDQVNLDPTKFDLPFCNLVFEGGGIKGLAYVGAAQYLEEIGVMSNIKRLAGASVGAIFATLVALGYTSSDIRTILDRDLEHLLCDGSWLSMIPNVFSYFGWHPLTRFENFLADAIAKKTGTADTTFRQLLKNQGRELCIVVTNLSQMKVEYFHPKTSPDMKILTAVLMSMAIPGMFTAKTSFHQGSACTMIDGGTLCNYPVDCFDGWYLSMKKEDSFLLRLDQELNNLGSSFGERFKEETLNKRTVGFVVYQKQGNHPLREEMIKQAGGKPALPAKPTRETKLYLAEVKAERERKQALKLHQRLVEASKVFINVLQKHNLDKNDVIEREELKKAFLDKSFYQEHSKILFGGLSVDEALEHLDENRDGQIHYSELMAFMEEQDLILQPMIAGSRTVEVNSVGSFLAQLVSTFLNNSYRINIQQEDMERTVGIDTGHVAVFDFQLEREDKLFLEQRGYHACQLFVQQFIKENQCPLKVTSTETS